MDVSVQQGHQVLCKVNTRERDVYDMTITVPSGKGQTHRLIETFAFRIWDNSIGSTNVANTNYLHKAFT